MGRKRRFSLRDMTFDETSAVDVGSNPLAKIVFSKTASNQGGNDVVTFSDQLAATEQKKIVNEVFEAIGAGTLPRPPVMDTLGMEPVEVLVQAADDHRIDLALRRLRIAARSADQARAPRRSRFQVRCGHSRGWRRWRSWARCCCGRR